MSRTHFRIESLESRVFFSGAPAATASLPDVFSISPAELAAAKSDLAAGSSTLDPALKSLTSAADSALSMAPVSVTDKTNPKGISSHDYVSYARYYWPNPNTKSGLPYINEDGHVNQAQVNQGDDGSISALTGAVDHLALAYYFTGNESYATHAVQLIETWFIDPATKMNPNLNHAQIHLGSNTGSFYGIIDFRNMYEVVDSLGLLKNSSAWTASDQKSMKSWLTQYNSWLENSSFGKAEAASPNNHGTWFDVQHEAILLYLGKTAEAKQVANAFGAKRIATEIKADGSQPLELNRADGWAYSVFNLQALEAMANLGQRVGVNLWTYQASSGASIRKAIDFMAPYADSSTAWPYNHLGNPLSQSDRNALIPLLLQAESAYGSAFAKWLGDLPSGAVASSQTHLFIDQ